MMGGLSFSSAAPVGSVAADLGRDEPSLGMGCIFPRVTWLSPLPVGQLQKACTGCWQSSPLSPCRDSPGLAHPGMWLLQSHQLTQEGTNSPLKGGCPF